MKQNTEFFLKYSFRIKWHATCHLTHATSNNSHNIHNTTNFPLRCQTDMRTTVLGGKYPKCNIVKFIIELSPPDPRQSFRERLIRPLPVDWLNHFPFASNQVCVKMKSQCDSDKELKVLFVCIGKWCYSFDWLSRSAWMTNDFCRQFVSIADGRERFESHRSEWPSNIILAHWQCGHSWLECRPITGGSVHCRFGRKWPHIGSYYPSSELLWINNKKTDEYIDKFCLQITNEDYRHFDYIFGMDHANINDLKATAPSDYTAEIKLLASYDYGKTDIIEDPYFVSRMTRHFSEKFI